MTCEEIIEEEAKIGAELLTSIKKRAITNDSWADFVRLKHILAGQKPNLEELRTLQLYWTGIVKRLHVRIYHNPEFEPTLTENIEQPEQLEGYLFLARLGELGGDPLARSILVSDHFSGDG